MTINKEDISSSQDIELLVNTFYDKVKKDDTIGFIFNDIIGDDWSKHLPIMYQFWETVLLGRVAYTGNPVRKHIDIDQKIKLEKKHYEKWLALWTTTVDDLFSGTIAEEAKSKARNMMQLIDIKVTAARSGKSIL